MIELKNDYLINFSIFQHPTSNLVLSHKTKILPNKRTDLHELINSLQTQSPRNIISRMYSLCTGWINFIGLWVEWERSHLCRLHEVHNPSSMMEIPQKLIISKSSLYTKNEKNFLTMHTFVGLLISFLGITCSINFHRIREIRNDWDLSSSFYVARSQSTATICCKNIHTICPLSNE